MDGIQDFETAMNKVMDDLEDMRGALKDGVLAGASDDIEYVDDHLDYAYNALRDAYEGLEDLHNASDKDYEGVGY